MRKAIPVPGFRPLHALGLVVILVSVSVGNANAQGPVPGGRLPGRPGPLFDPFSGIPALPGPIPGPFPGPGPFPYTPLPPNFPAWSQFRAGVPTDRCLVVPSPSPIDARSVKVAPSIDPGIFAEPRVQGLSLGRPAPWPRR